LICRIFSRDPPPPPQTPPPPPGPPRRGGGLGGGADGSIYMNESSGQLFITVSRRPPASLQGAMKNKFLLDALVELYGGTIYAPLPGLSSLPAGPQPTQPPGGGQWVVYLFLFLFLFFNKFKN